MNASSKSTQIPAQKLSSQSINLFQLIYLWIREYEASFDQKVLNLSLGNPDLIPSESIRQLKSKYQGLSDYALHTYAEDQNLNQFCQGCVETFTQVSYENYPALKAIPIAGIKTASALLPLACGLHLKQKFTLVTQDPAYDVIGTWDVQYLRAQRVKWSLDEPGMRMNLESLKQTLQKEGLSPQEIDLIYVIRPGNPAPVGASEKEWKELIEFCIQYQIRLVNDGAYTTLAPNSGAHTPLIQVAKDYPNLEWAELFSMSKALSDPGSRLGVMVGSSSFIEDYRLIKGNTDSGPNPGLMSAYGEFFKNKTTAQAELKSIALIYQQRLEYLVRQLKQAGFQQECETSAGFFTLWKVPREAFGVSIQQRAKEQGCSESQAFNQLMIQKTGIVGVHFSIGPQARPLIRYAVCSDILNPSFQKRLEACLKTLQLSY